MTVDKSPGLPNKSTTRHSRGPSKIVTPVSFMGEFYRTHRIFWIQSGNCARDSPARVLHGLRRD